MSDNISINNNSREVLLWSPNVVAENSEEKLLQFIRDAKNNYGICESTSLSVLTHNNGDFVASYEEISLMQNSQIIWSNEDVLKLFMLLEIFKYNFKLLTKVFVGRTVKDMILCWYLNKTKKSIHEKLQVLATAELNNPLLLLHKIPE